MPLNLRQTSRQSSPLISWKRAVASGSSVLSGCDLAASCRYAFRTIISVVFSRSPLTLRPSRVSANAKQLVVRRGHLQTGDRGDMRMKVKA